MSVTQEQLEFVASRALGWRYEPPTSSSAGPIYGKQPARPGGWRDPTDDTLHHLNDVVYGAGPSRIVTAMRCKHWKMTLEAWPLPTGICTIGFRHHYSGAADGGSALEFGEAVVMAAYNALTTAERK